MLVNDPFFHETVQAWYDPLFRFALSLCRDRDDALDLTQNAFHKLAMHRASLRDEGKVKSWLFSTAHREFIDQCRRHQRHPSTSLDMLPEAEDPDSHKAERSYDAARLMELLGEMDDKFRAPLTLFYLECFSYKEIAEVLDIPIGTVMSRLRRGKDRLRERMEAVRSPQILLFPGELRHG